MQTQRKANWLPISFIALAGAIVVAGAMIANSITTTSTSQVQAQRAQTAAIYAATSQAQSDALQQQVALNNVASQQLISGMLYGR